jgi:hypothetical protein
MGLNWKLGLVAILLAAMVFTTPFFARAETKQFSAYAACRKVAMDTKSYAVWTHQQTIKRMFRPRILFTDGFSTIDCYAIGVGPFWTIRMAKRTWAQCNKDLGNGQSTACPEDYFGVSP